MIGFVKDIPFLFPLVFGFFNIIILWIALWIWFGKSRVRVEFDIVHLSKTILAIGSRTTLNKSDITKIDEHITLQSGDTPYYTIRMYTTDGKKDTVGGIKNKDEVRHLIKLLNKVLGLS